MSILTRRLTFKDLPILFGTVLRVAVVVCLVLTMIRVSWLETEVGNQGKRLQGLNRVEVVEQAGVLPFPGEKFALKGRVEFPQPYDSPPHVTFTKVWGAGDSLPFHLLPWEARESVVDRLPKDVQEQRRNKLKNWGVEDTIPVDLLPKEVQENMLKKLNEQAERIRGAFAVKATDAAAFEWEFDLRQFGATFPEAPCSVFWDARGLQVHPPE